VSAPLPDPSVPAPPAAGGNWWKPWRRDFWAVDVVLGVIGLAISLVATVLVFYLSSGLDAAIRSKADEAQALNAALNDNARSLFDVSTTFAMQRSMESYADAFAETSDRRRLNDSAMALAARAFVAYLAATAPEAINGFETDAARLLAAYGQGQEDAPLKLRALTSALMDGPSTVANAAKNRRRPQVAEELSGLRRERDHLRAAGGFLQVFGLILAVAGHVAGRKQRTRQHAPPEIRALPSHIFTRRFWTIDVVGIAIGTAISLSGVAVLFFVVDAHQRSIDETRHQLDGRETLIVVSEAAFREYDRMAMLEPLVRDIEARRSPASHVAPGVRSAWSPGDDITAIEIPPVDYVAVRKSFPVYWLMRMFHDNVRTRYAEDEERFHRIVQRPASAEYLAMEADILVRARERMAGLAAERGSLGEALSASERNQSRARDLGALLLLIGLVLTFAGNVAYYKRPRR